MISLSIVISLNRSGPLRNSSRSRMHPGGKYVGRKLCTVTSPPLASERSFSTESRVKGQILMYSTITTEKITATVASAITNARRERRNHGRDSEVWARERDALVVVDDSMQLGVLFARKCWKPDATNF